MKRYYIIYCYFCHGVCFRIACIQESISTPAALHLVMIPKARGKVTVNRLVSGWIEQCCGIIS